ncbi:MAG: HlyD family type I secretion periplasmic adaptor subunit [Pseudomonadota bacterium]
MSSKSRPKFSPARPMIIGFLTVLILVGGFGAWAVLANIAGAVIASGQIVVDKNRQVIQHPDGGVVATVVVDEGDSVSKGDLLIQLDGTLLRSELAITEGQLFEMMARRGRLEAEREDADEIVFDTELIAAADNHADIAGLVAGQDRLFQARKDSMRKEIEQLQQRRAQLQNQVSGIDAQMQAGVRQKELIESELENQQTLLDKGLAQATRVLSLQREEARLAGALGNFTAQRAESLGRIAELETEELKLLTQQREEAITRLRDLRYNELQLTEERNALLERLSRLDIRAPVSGIVYNLQIFGEKSVVRPAEAVLYLVPQDRPLVIEARVPTIHVDQIHQEQPVVLRFSAFDTRTTPDMDGYVTRISPDAFENEQTGTSYYQLEIELPEGELDKLPEGSVLIPGMPVDAFVRTDDRSPMSYIVEPLAEYISRAFRES